MNPKHVFIEGLNAVEKEYCLVVLREIFPDISETENEDDNETIIVDPRREFSPLTWEFGYANVLSQDEFHNAWMVSDDVVEAFQGMKYGIRNTYNRGHLIYAGRAIQNFEEEILEKKCFCDELFVDPYGRLFHCGCQKVQYGTVNKPKFPKEYWEDTEFRETCSVFK